MKTLNSSFVQTEKQSKVSPLSLACVFEDEKTFIAVKNISVIEYGELIERADRALKVVNDLVDDLTEKEQFINYNADELLVSFISDVWQKVRSSLETADAKQNAASKVQSIRQSLFEKVDDKIYRTIRRK